MFSLQIKNKQRNYILYSIVLRYIAQAYIEKWRELVFSLKYQMWMALTSFFKSLGIRTDETYVLVCSEKHYH